MHPASPYPLPDYENPPVIEVVIGAQFIPIEGFLPTHHGLFWESIRDEYPTVEAAPPLSPVVERFSEGGLAGEAPQVDVYSIPPLPRVLFIDRTDSWLIQLQPDRLLQNWRKGARQNAYPRFPVVREQFEKTYRLFTEFCKSQGLARPQINQLEVTYINHIPAGQGWTSPKDFGAVFPDMCWRMGTRFLPPPEAIAWKAAFAFPEKQGRLHVSVRQAIRKADQTAVLLCELTARGNPVQNGPDSISEWIESAREWIVRGFADLMSDELQHKQWRRKA